MEIYLKYFGIGRIGNEQGHVFQPVTLYFGIPYGEPRIMAPDAIQLEITRLRRHMETCGACLTEELQIDEFRSAVGQMNSKTRARTLGLRVV